MLSKSTLLRISRTKEGFVSIDPAHKIQARAAYLCKNSTCLEKAKKSKGLERSFKGRVPPEIYVQLTENFENLMSLE